MKRCLCIIGILLVLIVGRDAEHGLAAPAMDTSRHSIRMKRLLQVVELVHSMAQTAEIRGEKAETSENRLSEQELKAIDASIKSINGLSDRIRLARIFKSMLGGDADTKDYDVPIEWAYWSAVKLIATDPGEAARDVLKEFAIGSDAGEALNIHHYQHLQNAMRIQYLKKQNTKTTAKTLTSAQLR